MNGSNHWVLRQPGQVDKIYTWPEEHEVPFAATIGCLPSHQKIKMNEPQTPVSPLLGLISVAKYVLIVDG